MKKRFKISLSFTLVLILTMTSSYSSVYAKSYKSANTVLSYSKSADYAIASYDTIKKLAIDKAKVLTSYYGVANIQYALIDNGEIIISDQVSVNNSKVTDTTMYSIGSIGKLFTTVAIMQLVEQGKVKLDLPVTNYISDFKMNDPRFKNITVRMLLNHSSGLMGSTLNNVMLFDDKDFSTYNNFLKILSTSRLKSQPGDFSVYCNDGFILAEKLINSITGISFNEYITTNIINDLNLIHTKTLFDKYDKQQLAKIYINSTNNTLPYECLNMSSIGGITSTAKELCKFATIFMNRSNSKILSMTSNKLMQNPEYLKGLWLKDTISTYSYGLGWDSVNTYPFEKYGIKALSKSGDTSFYHSNLTVLPEENIAIAILSSGGSSSSNKVMAQKILLEVLKAKGSINNYEEYNTFSKIVSTQMPNEIKQYKGTYANYCGVYDVDISDGGILTITNELQSTSYIEKYFYAGNGRFYCSDGSGYLSFINEKNGNTYLCVSSNSTFPGLGQMLNSEYQAQKLKLNPVSSDILNTWKKRDKKKFFVVNEKYSSQLYAFGAPSICIQLLNNIKGYCMDAKIIDKNTARSPLQIPGFYGRDLSDYKFYKVKNAEYLETGGSICISENALEYLPSNSKFACTINNDGYAKWFKIGSDSVNKKIKVTLPINSSFAVYDAAGNYVNCSYISNQHTVTLPSNGYVVFVGEKKAKFTVKYVK